MPRIPSNMDKFFLCIYSLILSKIFGISFGPLIITDNYLLSKLPAPPVDSYSLTIPGIGGVCRQSRTKVPLRLPGQTWGRERNFEALVRSRQRAFFENSRLTNSGADKPQNGEFRLFTRASTLRIRILCSWLLCVPRQARIRKPSVNTSGVGRKTIMASINSAC